jgi:Alpha/beta hydrolase domain
MQFQLRLRPIMTAFVGAVLAMVGITGQAAAASMSRVTQAEIAGSQAIGSFAGVPYGRIWGVLHGVADPGEKIAGLDALPKDSAGFYDWTAEFEVIAPDAAAPSNSAVFVEAENRGNAIFLRVLNGVGLGGSPMAARYPDGGSPGFLFDHGISYARVQWQTGIAAGVPEQAQGIGELIMRDFGRWLAGDAAQPPGVAIRLGPYSTRLLGGISQSAWFVDTFIAEGFNADPARGTAIYGGAIAIDGTGNWMSLNRLAQQNGFPQYPYVNEAAHPLVPQALLSRPVSDPFYIDVANYNDFFRVRASLSAESGFPAQMRRYDWPSPHIAGSAPIAAALFGGGGRCNKGVAVPLDPIGYGPYARALVLGLAHEAGLKRGDGEPVLPPNTLFQLQKPPSDPDRFNALPGAAPRVPALDAEGQPIGGVRFPEVDHPIGKPGFPVPHLGLDSITDTCGNALGWDAYSADELKRRYGSEDDFLKQYGDSVDRLIAQGYVLPPDKPGMLKVAAALYRAPAGY